NPNINAPGWYYITVEDTTNHCINTDSVFIDQNILAPDATLGPDLVFTCADTLLTIDGTATSSSGNPLRYFWYSVNGLIDQGQGTLRIQVKSAGEYFLVATDSLNGCADTAMISIRPDLNLPSAAILPADTLNCIRNSILLNGMASSPAGNPISYRWTSGAGQNIQNPNSLNPGITEAGEYFLTVIDQVNGCSATVKTVVVIDTIKPLAIAGPDQVWNCSTKQLMLDARGSSGNHSLLFDWTTPDGVILSSPSNSQILAGAAGTYFLTVVDPVNGCVSSDQLSLTPDLQTPVANIASADTLNCIRSSITISGSGSSSGNRIQYRWTTNNGQIISPADQLDIQVNLAGIYLLLVVDTINHCRDSQNVVIIEDKILPLVQAGPDTQLDCQTTNRVLLGTVGNPSGSERFLWTTLQGNITGRNDSIQAGIDKAGTYILQVTNARNGCSQTDTLVVRFVNNLSVDAGPSLELTCSIVQGDLTGSITNGNGAETIQWTTLQGRFAGATNGPRATIDRPGVYYFRVNNPLTGCSGLDSVVVTENTNRPTDLQLSVQQPKCPGDSWFADLSQITGGVPPYRYFLDNNPNPGNIFQGQSSGNHNIRILDANGCPLDRSFVITDPLPVSVQIQPSVKLQAGDSYALQPLYSIPDDSIDWVRWSPSDFLSCTDCKYPTVRAIDRDIEYIVTFANKNGCTASARIRIEVIRRNIWIPNAFSPNGDNINDSFFPVVSEESFNEIRSMQIFDRWGNLVYSASHFPPNDPAYGWTGESGGDKLNPGVFVYLIELEWKNGEVEKFFGDLSLIR
ncbi:MAG TPA: gliding motility-associated C-terminal domain-containing protein, partial [Saprospiraceae bacterium]|nr:gliding motility-associated C-terminal domain-containing protein [Saprospiraceae bacterium]